MKRIHCPSCQTTAHPFIVMTIGRTGLTAQWRAECDCGACCGAGATQKAALRGYRSSLEKFVREAATLARKAAKHVR